MEVKKDHQRRTIKGYLVRACCRKGVSYHHWCLAEMQRQAVVKSGGKKRYSEEKKKTSFRYVVIANHWHGKLETD